MTERRPATFADVPAIIAEYDRVVRANASEEWDTIKGVAEDRSGLYGVWGEVLDTADALGLDLEAAGPGVEEALQAATAAYQAILTIEVETRP